MVSNIIFFIFFWLQILKARLHSARFDHAITYNSSPTKKKIFTKTDVYDGDRLQGKSFTNTLERGNKATFRQFLPLSMNGWVQQLTIQTRLNIPVKESWLLHKYISIISSLGKFGSSAILVQTFVRQHSCIFFSFSFRLYHQTP